MVTLKTQSICNGVNFNNVYIDKFKTGRISATFFLPLQKETASENAILSYMLIRKCKKHPSFLELNKKLSELYGAALRVNVFKIGEAQAFTISINCIEDKYALKNESILKKLAQLLCDIILDPFLEHNGLFSQKDLDFEKQQLIGLIESEYSDKRLFAKNRCEELMCENEAFSINKYGSKATINSITTADITNAWKRTITNARIEIMQIGSSDPQKIFPIFKEAFSNISRINPLDIQTKIIRSADAVKEYTDIMDVTQCKLVLGFRTSIANNDPDVMACRLMCAIFGGTPSSKLFLNVREKMSLCYYCSSRYDKNKGIMMVQSGVEAENIDKSKSEILHQLDLIKQGDFTKDEIQAAKMSLSNDFRTITDHLVSIELFYLMQMFDEKFLSPEQMVKNINLVSKENIIQAANKITLDTIYTLKGSMVDNI